jgi:RNA polymerase sigma-70 factor (ECF subfamily)
LYGRKKVLGLEQADQARPIVTGSIFGLNTDAALEQELSCEDAALVQGLREGAESAYEELLARFQQPVYNLALRLLSEPSDASDVVQEVFLKIFRNVGNFRGQSSLKTWVYRITVNEAYNARRWFFRHRRGEVGLEEEHEDSRSPAEVLADSGRSPFDHVLDLEKQELIEQALRRINPLFREAVVLRDITDLSYEEVAQVLKVSLGTVKSRILRGREALRDELEGRLEPERVLRLVPKPAE